MKRIPLNNRGQFKAYDVLLAMIEQPLPNQGLNYAEIKKRQRLLDALDKHKAESFVDLEDGDHDHLIQILEQFPFGTAKRDLKLILDDIALAKEPDKTTQLRAVREGG
jgi:hypothetical protein